MDAITPQIDLTALPFDVDAMLDGLRPWIECESPTHDAAAVDRMVDLATYDLAACRRGHRAHPGPHGPRAARCGRPSRTRRPASRAS